MSRTPAAGTVTVQGGGDDSRSNLRELIATIGWDTGTGLVTHADITGRRVHLTRPRHQAQAFLDDSGLRGFMVTPLVYA